MTAARNSCFRTIAVLPRLASVRVPRTFEGTWDCPRESGPEFVLLALPCQTLGLS